MPPEAINWLASLDSDSIKRVLDRVQWSWAGADPSSMANFLASFPGDSSTAQADSLLARELSRRNPTEALEWASLLPENRSRRAGGAAFIEWRSAQPEAAMQWLNELPPTDPRRESYFQTTIQSLVHHPQAAQQLAAMTPPEQTAARRVIENLKLSAPRRTTLLDALP